MINVRKNKYKGTLNETMTFYRYTYCPNTDTYRQNDHVMTTDQAIHWLITIGYSVTKPR